MRRTVNIVQVLMQWAALALFWSVNATFGKISVALYLLVASYGIYKSAQEQAAKVPQGPFEEKPRTDVRERVVDMAEPPGWRGRKDVS